MKKGDSFWWGFIRVFMAIYIIAIFIGIVKGEQSLILLGNVCVFSYGFMTSIYFNRLLKGFHESTKTILGNREKVGGISLMIGLVAFLLETHCHLFSEMLPFSITLINDLLMGFSLVILYYDSRKVYSKSEETEC